MSRVPARTFSMHGGAGALISVGLLRSVSYDHMHRCVHGAYSSGGDAFITECLWEVRSFSLPYKQAQSQYVRRPACMDWEGW